MLTLIRNNQKYLLIVVTILICAAFGWFLMRSDTTTGQVSTVATVNGADISKGEFDDIRGQRFIPEVLSLPSYNTLIRVLVPPVASVLTDGDQQSGNFELAYVVAVHLVRDEAERLGIAVSDEEIGKAIRDSPAFQTNGQYDPARWDAFAKSDASQPSSGIMVTTYNQFGMPEESGPFTLAQSGNDISDLKQAVSDFLLLDKLITTIGGGVLSADWIATDNYNVTNQIVIADVIRFDSEAMKAEVDTSDEKVEAYYEENKDRYLTEEQRVVQYVRLADDSLKPEPTPQEAAKLTPEELEADRATRRASRTKLGRKADEVLDLLYDGKSFEEAATEAEVDLITTAPFGISNPPEGLRSSIAAQSAISRLASQDDKAQIVADGDSFFVIKLKDTIDSAVKPFDAVREEVKADLISASANDLAREKANAAHEKLVAAEIKDGASLKDLQTKLDLKGGVIETDVRMAPAGMSQMQAPDANLRLRSDLLEVPTMGISEVINNGDGFTVALVRDRQIERAEDKAAQIEATQDSIAQRSDFATFILWWAGRVAEAAPQYGQ